MSNNYDNILITPTEAQLNKSLEDLKSSTTAATTYKLICELQKIPDRERTELQKMTLAHLFNILAINEILQCGFLVKEELFFTIVAGHSDMERAYYKKYLNAYDKEKVEAISIMYIRSVREKLEFIHAEKKGDSKYKFNA